MTSLRCFLVLLLVWSSGAIVVAQPPDVASPVTTAQVIRGSVKPYKTQVANIFPHRRSVIGSAVDGRVESFTADAGKEVQAGDELAVLRTATITIELEGAKAELALREAELAELKNGSLVEEIALAEARLAAAQAAARYAVSRFERAGKLFNDTVGLSQEEFELARSEALRADANLEEATNQLKLVKDGPRPERIAQAEARRDVQEQIVAGIEDRKRKYTLRSPFNGFVSRELTEIGAWVSQGDPVAEVIEIDPIEVSVNIPESNIPYVEIGQTCVIRVEAYPRRFFPGTVSFRIPEGDTRSRAFPVKILVENKPVDGKYPLLPGMLARVSLPSGLRENALLVPKDALNLNGERSTLIKLVDGKAVPVPVRQGLFAGTLSQVIPLEEGSLRENEIVVIRGNERLRPGQPVKVLQQIDTKELIDTEAVIELSLQPPVEEPQD